MCMRCAFHCPKNAIKIGLFNKWKVNGAYTFLPPAEEEEERHTRYCKNSYEKYFESARARVLARGGDFPDELLLSAQSEEEDTARAASDPRSANSAPPQNARRDCTCRPRKIL